MLGLVLFCQGELIAARSIFKRALDDYDAERDGEARFRFGRDTEVIVTANLALTEWHLGEVERARHLIDQAIRRADDLGHVPTTVQARFWNATLESRRSDASATRLAAEALLELTEEYGIKTFAILGQFYAKWARGRLFDPERMASELSRALAEYVAQGNRVVAPSFHGLLAELETTTRGTDVALG